MNLQKLFNYKFLRQNLKKSAAFLGVFLGLVPILNVVILLAIGMNKPAGMIASMLELSFVNALCLCAIPVILSICLFGYVFKKKSVDFIGSMPIDRKSLFVTNTIGGIVILLGIMFINALCFGIISLLFSNIIIPFKLIIDYFILWSIAYIFVFIVTNLAISVSGNLISAIIVTLTILLIIPFTYDYATDMFNSGNYYYARAGITCKDDACKPERYFCYGDIQCENDIDNNIYRLDMGSINKKSFTMPYQIFYGLYSGTYDGNADAVYNGVSIIKMIVLSIVYFFIGLFLFLRRKMEVCETSFKNVHVHSTVKIITMIPLLIALLEIVREADSIFILIALIIAIAYFLIYDLITRKSLVKFRVGIFYFLGIIAIMPGFTYLVHYRADNRYLSYGFKVTDIKSISLEDIEEVAIDDKSIINLIIASSTSEYLGDYNNAKGNSYIITLNNNKQYRITAQMKLTDYEKVIDYIIKDKKYSTEYDYNKVLGIGIGGFSVNAKDYQDIIKVIEKKTADKEYQKASLLSDEWYNTISLYVYKNHKYYIKRVNVDLIPELFNFVSKFHNDRTREALAKYPQETFYFSLLNYELDEEKDFDYLVSYGMAKITSFAKKTVNKEFDINKDYFVLSTWINNTEHYVYSNEIEYFQRVLSEIRNMVKDTEDYQMWKSGYSGYAIEVYQ